MTFHFPRTDAEIARIIHIANVFAAHARRQGVCQVTGVPRYDLALITHRHRDNPAGVGPRLLSSPRWELVGDEDMFSYTLRIDEEGNVCLRSADAQALTVVPADADSDPYLPHCEILAAVDCLPIAKGR